MALRGQPPGASVSHLPTLLPGPQPVFPSYPATSALRSEGLPGESPLPFVTRRDAAVCSGVAETCQPGQSGPRGWLVEQPWATWQVHWPAPGR